MCACFYSPGSLEHRQAQHFQRGVSAIQAEPTARPRSGVRSGATAARHQVRNKQDRQPAIAARLQQLRIHHIHMHAMRQHTYIFNGPTDGGRRQFLVVVVCMHITMHHPTHSLSHSPSRVRSRSARVGMMAGWMGARSTGRLIDQSFTRPRSRSLTHSLTHSLTDSTVTQHAGLLKNHNATHAQMNNAPDIYVLFNDWLIDS